MPAHVDSQAKREDHREWIGGAVKTLVTIVSGDWPTNPLIDAEMGFMWANTLEGFPRATIETAIDEYVRTESRRPTPAAIRSLCIKHSPRPPLPAYEPLNTQPPSPEERARIFELTGQAFPELREMPREKPQTAAEMAKFAADMAATFGPGEGA